MIDFHSHMLPGIDDGAADVDMSLKMLTRCRAGGVTQAVMTPHCHPRTQAHIDRFIENRGNAEKILSSAVKRENKPLPEIIPASEIRIYDGFHKYKNLDKLCIKGTNYILLEMPYEVWRDYAFEEIYQILRLGFRPIIAHLDRFLDQEKLFPEIFALDTLIQINSSAIIDKKSRKKMLEFFEAGHFQLLGSDCHNLEDRSPDVNLAYDIIAKKFGKEYTDYIDYAGHSILKNEDVYVQRFPKMNALKKIML